MHLDEEQIERLRHGELPGKLERSIREHVAGCSECSSRVAKAGRDEDELYSLLRVLDRPLPRVDASAVVARARRAELRRWRWAAALIVAAGIGSAAYAMPGSPLPGWMRQAVSWVASRGNPSPAAPAQLQRGEPALAGVAIAPGRELLIQFTSHQTSGDARVSLTEGGEVIVRTVSGAAGFTTDSGRLVINNAGSTATFEILIPRTAPRVEIRVNGSRVFLKEGARVSAGDPADVRGVYVLRLGPPSS